MNKTNTLMIRWAAGLLWVPLVWFSVQYFDREAKVEECALIAWNLDHFGLTPGSEGYFRTPPSSRKSQASFEPYKKALRQCNKTVPQVWTF